jgi:hypothetical protein
VNPETVVAWSSISRADGERVIQGPRSSWRCLFLSLFFPQSTSTHATHHLYRTTITKCHQTPSSTPLFTTALLCELPRREGDRNAQKPARRKPTGNYGNGLVEGAAQNAIVHAQKGRRRRKTYSSTKRPRRTAEQRCCVIVMRSVVKPGVCAQCKWMFLQPFLGPSPAKPPARKEQTLSIRGGGLAHQCNHSGTSA